ncbi:7806_t:CDS:2 [Entrophospora sp. SA101]|nr:7806_t:CDS:2 [Entrophospora sp. SA101]
MDPNSGISFADFFERFQKERSQGNKEIKSYAESYTGKEEEKAAIEKYEQEKLEMKASPYK